MRKFLMWFLLLAALSTASCGSLAASPVERQLSQGQAIYEESCATEACHGIHGEGIRKENQQYRDWPLVGEEFQRRNPTAQVLFDVVRSGGERELRALTDQQVYDAIAFELSLNGVELAEPLNDQNAPWLSSGAAAQAPAPGGLYPPPGNANLVSGWNAPSLPLAAENRELRMRLTQIGLAESIGGNAPPDGGVFVIAVFTLEDLAERPLQLGPQDLELVTQEGMALEPLDVGLSFPVARFYPQTIQPEHGTAAAAVFGLPQNAEPAFLRYLLPADQPLEIDLGASFP